MTQRTLLVCRQALENKKNQGTFGLFNRTLIAVILVFMALAASAAAVTLMPVPHPSNYVLLGAGVLALVLLRRRTS